MLMQVSDWCISVNYGSFLHGGSFRKQSTEITPTNKCPCLQYSQCQFKGPITKKTCRLNLTFNNA